MLTIDQLTNGLIIFNDNKAVIGKIQDINNDYITLRTPFELLSYNNSYFYIYYNQNNEDFIQYSNDGFDNSLNGWKIYNYITDIQNPLIREKIYQYELQISKQKIDNLEETLSNVVAKFNTQISKLGELYNSVSGQYTSNSTNTIYFDRLNNDTLLNKSDIIIDFYPKLKEKLEVLIENG